MQLYLQWSEFLSPETNGVTRLIERLDEHQCDDIANLQPLKIPDDNRHHLLSIFLLRYPSFENQMKEMHQDGSYLLNVEYVLYLRYIAVRYLNMLESIVSAWVMGIVDQKMIESQFSYLLDEAKGRSAMDNSTQ